MDLQLVLDEISKETSKWVSAEYSEKREFLREACESKILVFKRVLKEKPDPQSCRLLAFRSQLSLCKSILARLDRLG